MEDYFHATKVGQHSVVKLAQSYLKGYASTWWRTMRQEERKTNGYTWEFFKKHIKLEFTPKNSNYISRCKLCDLMNATNDNLHQYVKVYSKLMLTPTFFLLIFSPLDSHLSLSRTLRVHHVGQNLNHNCRFMFQNINNVLFNRSLRLKM
jgi:hypothetical protein